MPTNPKQMSMISSRNLFGLLKFKTIPFIHSFLWQHEPYLILYLDMNNNWQGYKNLKQHKYLSQHTDTYLMKRLP